MLAANFEGQQRATALGLYLTLTWMASEQRTDQFQAFVRQIADRAGLGLSTTRRYLAQFEELGLITVERSMIAGLINDRNSYFLVDPPPPAGESTPPVTERIPPPASERGTPANERHPHRQELTDKEEQQQDEELLLFIDEVKNALEDEGVSPLTAQELAKANPDLAADWLEAKREWQGARNPAGLLVAKIRAGEQPPRPRQLRWSR